MKKINNIDTILNLLLVIFIIMFIVGFISITGIFATYTSLDGDSLSIGESLLVTGTVISAFGIPSVIVAKIIISIKRRKTSNIKY